MADAELLELAPIEAGTSRPFLFPAVSERPWVDVIVADGRCQYKDYGYREYGQINTGESGAVKTRIMPGMRVVPHANVPTAAFSER